MQVGAAHLEMPQSEFVNLVKKLLKCRDERERFFQVSGKKVPSLVKVTAAHVGLP